MSNIVFILIGMPFILITLIYCPFLWNRSNESLKIYLKTKYKHLKSMVFLGIFASFIVLFLVTVCMTNVQSGTRFFSAHPMFYIILGRATAKSQIVKSCIFCYCLGGIILYSIGFPWT